jgi:hypothetical protein
MAAVSPRACHSCALMLAKRIRRDCAREGQIALLTFLRLPSPY